MRMYLGSGRFAAAVACCGAVAALGAGASSAFGEAAEGFSIYGSGSSLQKTAQISIWSAAFPKAPENELTNKGEVTVTYSSTSSGKGLAEFGDGPEEGSKKGAAGTLYPEEDSVAHAAGYLDAFVGSDDPPTSEQMAFGKTASGSNQIVVPVAQAPVAIILSLPSETTEVKKGGTKVTSIDITNEVLGKIYDAEVKTWGELATAAGYELVGGGGTKAITLQAREVGSGTTWTLRDYLFLIHNGYKGTGYGYAKEYNESNVTDSQAENKTSGWPVKVEEKGNEKGSGLAEKTASTPGSIGYANLADAVNSGGFSATLTASTKGGSTSHLIAYALVEDNGSAATPRFANPANGKAGNVDVTHKIKAGGSGSVGNWVDPETASGAWGNAKVAEGTYASDPNVWVDAGEVAEYYPIVAATYDLAWENYKTTTLEKVGNYGAHSTTIGNTAWNYLKYILSPEGQKAPLTEYYAEVPSTPLSSAKEHQLKHINEGK